jgi:hypothetical protein
MEATLKKTQVRKTTPSVTAKYHIEVPLNKCYSTKCIYKVTFGKKFYIGKAKTLLQSCEMMATLIERALRTGTVNSADMYYHVVQHIKRTRTLKAYAEMIHDGDNQPESELLKVEQQLLTKHKDNPDCLNNSFDAYIPKWIPAIEIKKFNKWKYATNKSKRAGNSSINSRKKYKG